MSHFRSLIKIYSPLIASLILFLIAVEPSRAEQLPIRTYTTADGLARDQIYKIVTDPRGFLWFCTYDGLSRFDGYEFVNYSVASGLPHRMVYDILITSKGDYWVATSAGIARFNPFAASEDPKFKTYVPSLRPGSEVVPVLREGHDGTIWVGTSNGLYRLREVAGDWQFEYVNLGEQADERVEVTSLVEDSPGVLWTGTYTGLYRRFQDGTTERFTTKNGLPHDHVRDILKDPDGTVWVATGLGLCRLVSEVRLGKSIVSRLYTTKDGMLSDGIYALLRTSTGWLWVATTLGLSEFVPDQPNGGGFINYTREHGIQDAEIRTIAEDHDGNLWLGSASAGAMKVTRRGFTSYSEADGLELDRIAAIGEARNGELYVVTGSLKVPSFHIHRFDGRRFENIRVNLPPKVNPSWGWNQLFVQDRMQQWWVPTAKGLFQFPTLHSLKDFSKAPPLKVYTSGNGLAGDEVFRLFEDSRGDLWISLISTSAKSYLNKWERATGKFYYYNSEEISSRADNSPTAFQEDGKGNLWIGFYNGGLARYHEGKFETFTKADGVPPGMIRALYLDRTGRLWVASTDGGLARVDDPTQEHPTFAHYTMKEGLSSDQITCITEDQWGRIYLGTGLGLDRLDPVTGRVKRYTVADGLPNGFVNVAYRDHNNDLWFGTLQGLAKLTPALDGPSQPPPILIQAVRVAGSALPISELGVTQLANLELDANKNQLEIKFASLGFRPGDVRRYQFMLEGADQDWGAPVDQRTVNYANLRPGTYRFRVRAVNADGLASSEPAWISFTIVPPIWLRWWFVTLIVLFLGIVTHLVYLYHTRRLIELERIRTRIATDLHDDIGANLSKIAILSDVAGQELMTTVDSPVAVPLTEIANTSRDCVDAMSDIVWAVNPQRDHLSDLTHRMRRFAEDLLDAKDIDFTIRSAVDEKDVRLGADLRREVYLIFKECVNNLVKHSGCRNAGLAFSITGAWLVVSIVDDGSGFKLDQASTNGRGAGMGGHGLLSMQRRAETLGGSLKIDSEPGKGTKVTLKVPVHHRQSWRWWSLNPNAR